jgi:hypothetical protein
VSASVANAVGWRLELALFMVRSGTGETARPTQIKSVVKSRAGPLGFGWEPSNLLITTHHQLLLPSSPCWGRRPSEASSTSGQADDFSSRAASVTRESFCNTGLTETLMLFRLCELCSAGVAHRGGTGHRWLHFGDEGSRGPEALRAGRKHLVRGRWQHRRDVLRGTTRPEPDPRLLRYRRCGAPGHVAAANV